jgi:hypothetical protein
MSQIQGEANGDAHAGAIRGQAGTAPDDQVFGPPLDGTDHQRSGAPSTSADAMADEDGPGSGVRELDAMAWAETLYWFG